MEYEFGGGIAGKLLGRAAEPIVRGNLQRSVETLKRNTEKLSARSRLQGRRRKPPQKLQQSGEPRAAKHHKTCNKASRTSRIQGEKLVEKRLE